MKLNHILILGFLALASAFSHAAPIGTSFTYQGRLDDGGVPANGSVTMSFQLRNANANTANTAVGSPINRTVNVVNGLFTEDLDFGAAAFDGNERSA